MAAGECRVRRRDRVVVCAIVAQGYGQKFMDYWLIGIVRKHGTIR